MDGPIGGSYQSREIRTSLPSDGHAFDAARAALEHEAKSRGLSPGSVVQDGLAFSMVPVGDFFTELRFVAGQVVTEAASATDVEAHLQQFCPPINTDPVAWMVIYTWETLCVATVVVDEDTLRRMGRLEARNGGRPSVPLSSAALERWRAPYFSGDELVFFANGLQHFYEVRVHRAHHYVERTSICDAHQEPMHLIRGRALMNDRRAVTPSFDPRDPWAVRAAEEAAAVLAFLRAHDELAAHGAPLELLARYKAAARDEARHARLCLRRAHTKLGKMPRPPARESSPKAIALSALFESAIPEALAVAEMAREDLDDEMRGVLDDERAHVALAWDTIAWAAKHEGVAEAVWRAAPDVLDTRKRAQALL